MSQDLKGKNIVITGGARGIGLAIAAAVRKNGASVALLARSQADLTQAEAELKKIEAPGSVLALRADVTKDADLERVYSAISDAQGAIHGLICAAGVYGAIGSFEKVNFDDWARTIEINLVGTARSIHRALPLMKSGARVILFSGGGQGPMPNFSDYVTSKGAIWRLTETLAAELAPRGIFVNAVAPGAVNTKLLDEVLSAGPQRVGQDFYQKSLKQRDSGGQSADKAADLCLYFLSKASAGLYGKTLSAIWDPYEELKELDALSKSDVFTYRRVIDTEGNTRN